MRRVILAARRVEPLQATAAEISAAGGQVHCLALDVIDPDAVQSAFAAIDEIGALDVVVNNAGSAGPGSLLDMTDETWDRLLDVNVKGAWHVARAAVRTDDCPQTAGFDRERRFGAWIRRAEGTANYPASKAALVHLTKAMAFEWLATACESTRSRPVTSKPTLATGMCRRNEAKPWSSACPCVGWVTRSS